MVVFSQSPWYLLVAFHMPHTNFLPHCVSCMSPLPPCSVCCGDIWLHISRLELNKGFQSWKRLKHVNTIWIMQCNIIAILKFETKFQQGATSCKDCPAGYSCPSPSSAIAPCAAGSFSVRGQANCTDCPIGYMCPSPKQRPIRCSLGSTTFAEGGKQTCTECPAGFKCPNPE